MLICYILSTWNVYTFHVDMLYTVSLGCNTDKWLCIYVIYCQHEMCISCVFHISCWQCVFHISCWQYITYMQSHLSVMHPRETSHLKSLHICSESTHTYLSWMHTSYIVYIHNTLLYGSFAENDINIKCIFRVHLSVTHPREKSH